MLTRIYISILISLSSFCSTADIRENIYGFPLGHATTLKELNYKGNIKSIKKNGYSITVRFGREFHKTSPEEYLNFNDSGNLTLSGVNSETVTETQYTYKNKKIDKIIQNRKNESFDDNLNDEIITDIYYKESKIYGQISKSKQGKGCTKFIYEDNKITRKGCHDNNRSIYEIAKDGRIHSILTIPEKSNRFKDIYSYSSNKITIENIVNDVIQRKTVINSDKHGNYVNKKTTILAKRDSPFGKKLFEMRSNYNIEKFDKFGNPVTATLSVFEKETETDEEKLIKTFHENFEYSYFD